MNLKFENREVELNFGIKFLRELNLKYGYKMEAEGNGAKVPVNLGNGIMFVYPLLESAKSSGDVEIVFDIIKFATVTNKKPATEDEILQFLGDLDEDGLENLVIDFLTTLGEAPLFKIGIRKLLKAQTKQ